MRKSFIVLCVSSSLLAIDNILHLVAPISGFSALSAFKHHASSICRIVFYMSLISFCAQTYSLLSKHRWTSAEQEIQPLRRSPEEVCCIAVSCCLALFFMVAITKQEGRFANAVTIYCLFLLTSALLIPPSGKGWKGNLANASWPAMFLLLSAMLLMPWAKLVHKNSAGKIIWEDVQFALLLVGASLVLAVLAIPGILIANLAKRALMALVLSVRGAARPQSNQLGRLVCWPLAALALAATSVIAA